LFFVSEAVLLESGSPLGSLARSSRLVLFRSLSCLGLALASLCAPFLCALAADLIGNTVVEMVFQMGRPFGSLIADGGSAYAVAGALLSAPFVASASFLGYIDMRTRKEGWDIQLRFVALAEGEGQHRRIAS
jgi:Ca2+/H+ antiporter